MTTATELCKILLTSTLTMLISNECSLSTHIYITEERKKKKNEEKLYYYCGLVTLHALDISYLYAVKGNILDIYPHTPVA